MVSIEQKCMVSRLFYARCSRLQKECLFAEAQPRIKRSKQTHTRVAEVEKKLDSIVALLQSNQSQSAAEISPARIADVGEQQNAPRTQSPPMFEFATPKSLPSVPVACTPAAPRLSSGPKGVWSDFVTPGKAEQLLGVYRTDSHAFPFVPVSSQASADVLSRERPFLFLAILYMGSYRQPKLQIAIDNLVRETLSAKIIVQGEISMDMLQGLLVYLAWLV